MAIKSKTANFLVLALGVILLLWASGAGLESALRGVRLNGADAVLSLVIGALGWWCLRGALANLKSDGPVDVIGVALKTAVVLDTAAIATFLVGSLAFFVLAEPLRHGLPVVGVALLCGLLLSVLAAPVLVVAWVVSVRRRSTGAA